MSTNQKIDEVHNALRTLELVFAVATTTVTTKTVLVVVAVVESPCLEFYVMK